MIARIITFHPLPDKVDELLHSVTNTVLPFMQQQAGCTLLTLLSDDQAHKVVTIGLWESAEDLLATEQSACYQEHIASVIALLGAPPGSESYIVHLQTAPI